MVGMSRAPSLLSLLPLVVCGAVLSSCRSTPAPVPEAAARACGTSIDDVAWFSGDWRQTAPTGFIDEHWTQAAGGSMLGMSRFITDGKTAFFEYLRVEARPDGLYYIAHPKARPGVEFKLVRCAEGEVLFENPQNDHPKRILYRRESGGGLVARIEGDEGGKAVAQDFVYTRM